ncbi:MAG TPA: AAA family ATPase, partial [Acidimicrobiales bacterium]|nr:AAA family ATPase [Acidimicrobiales bacterium]
MSGVHATPNANRQESVTSAKFIPPHLPPEWVHRDRLERQLWLATRRPLTVLTGPPGAGKSVLLADWARSCADGLVAWLSLEESDNGPRQFWRSVASALDVGQPNNEIIIEELAETGNEACEKLFLRRATESQPRVLVLDDFHLVTDCVVIQSIARLARHLPPHFHLVLAAQSTPGPWLERLVLSGEAVVICDRDLRFTLEECAALVALVARKLLPADDIEGLTQRSEGWAAGLHLAALALRDEADGSEFVRRFSGTFGPVSEYIGHETLQRQSPDIVRFLLQTSVLDRLTADLCWEVTGRGDAGELLNSLANQNLFVLPLGTRDQGYRYHRLFADLLRSRLPLEEPPLAANAHIAAATAYEGRGDVRSAAHHFAEAGAYDRALCLVFPTLALPPDSRVPDGHTHAPVGERLGVDVEEGPSQMYFAAATLMCAQRFDEAALVLRRVGHVTIDHQDQRRWEARTEFLWALYADQLGDAAAVIEDCLRVEELVRAPLVQTGAEPPEPAGEWLRNIDASISAQLPVLAARSHIWLGQFDEALAVLSGHPFTEDGGCAAILATIACRRGQLAEAYQLATAALGRAEAPGAAAIDLRLALSEVHFERNEIGLAQQHLEAALQYCRTARMGHRAWSVKIALARVMLAQGRSGEALKHIGQLHQDALTDPPPHQVSRDFRRVQIDCRLYVGDLEGARRLAASVPAGA